MGRFELRLDQSHQVIPGRGELRSRRERLCEADEADIGDDRRHLLADHLTVERPRVGAFQGHHPRIHPELGVKLAAADIDRIDFGGSACDQHVAEAAGRGADIERYRTLRVEAEGIERGCELFSAAGNVAARARAQAELGIGGHLDARLQRGDPRHADQSPPHQIGGTRAGRGQAAIH